MKSKVQKKKNKKKSDDKELHVLPKKIDIQNNIFFPFEMLT